MYYICSCKLSNFRKQQHQQQQMEKCEYSACSSPTGLDSREPFDLHLGKQTRKNVPFAITKFVVLSSEEVFLVSMCRS